MPDGPLQLDPASSVQRWTGSGESRRKTQNRVRDELTTTKILYWERNGFCLWLKRLESERFKTSPDITDGAIVLTVQELNWLLDGFDLWRNRPHQVLTPRFVA
ncbi:IS66 family insertion sequence element accessory protein TnpB [Pseudomonas mosselii]|nr:IS66 family insertion sequence element accessory protein TnpB [Pseudomonas mosselii]MBH3324742.1 IS66 family insertion sequence element accessory protein TnpB [Pseudomonas mosselii]